MPGVLSAITGSTATFRRADPLFAGPPVIPTTDTPWSAATPPWSIGQAFALLPGSPAVGIGTDPSTALGTTTEATQLTSYLARDLAGTPRTSMDLGAYEG